LSSTSQINPRWKPLPKPQPSEREGGAAAPKQKRQACRLNDVLRLRNIALLPILYKYCPPERVDIISTFRIRFSPPSDFNDAFDTRFIQQPTSETRREKLDRARRRNQFGILCLTQAPDNHLMWVNYAKNHTGFVIGFRTSSPFFQAGGSRLQHVKYALQPRSSPEYDACFYKSPDWEYEKEWRYVRTFGNSEDRLVDFVDKVPIAEIIFGQSMKDGDISEIVSSIDDLTKTSSLSTPVAFFQSTPDHKNQRFVNEPRTVEYCNHCHGTGFRMLAKQPLANMASNTT
jgi:hypothetical protein